MTIFIQHTKYGILELVEVPDVYVEPLKHYHD
jgi:hypothetical protein